MFDRVKKFADARHMSLPQIARMAGLSENAIYNWKKHTPTEATLRSVARVLGIPYNELVGKEEGDPKAELASQVGALFRSVVDQQDLDEASTEDLKQEMEDLLKVRAKRLREKQNGKG
jgi:transcriptional regulator with XRE-family HTH domain